MNPIKWLKKQPSQPKLKAQKEEYQIGSTIALRNDLAEKVARILAEKNIQATEAEKLLFVRSRQRPQFKKLISGNYEGIHLSIIFFWLKRLGFDLTITIEA
jgi:hypothetical protein